MRHSFSPRNSAMLVVLLVCLLLQTVSALRIIESSALEECQVNSDFTASLLNVKFTPDNSSVDIEVVGNSHVEGNITLDVQATVYGYTILRQTLDPCELDLTTLCPLTPQPLTFHNLYPRLSKSIVNRIPAIAYGIPDLDAVVTIHAHPVGGTTSVACMRSRLSNRHSVHQSAVGWATAAVAGGGLLTSAILSGLGHLNAATHLAVYTLSLFSYFQALAIFGLCAVPLPPIVQSWTQDFSWSLGIIRVNFLQKLATWYQVNTGGTQDTILATLDTTSVQVVKRGLEVASKALAPRATNDLSESGYIVKGIKRVAFRANMESSNIFLTCIIFLCIFLGFTLLGVVLFKFIVSFAVRKGWMGDNKFQNLRENFHLKLKGVVIQVLLICYPPIVILCLWEFTQIDSAAEVLLAVLALFGMTGALFWAAFNVMKIAKRSEQLHNTPAYLLFADSTVLNKWSPLYIQYQAPAYWWIMIYLGHTLIKGMFVAFAQKSGTVQAIALVVIELAMLIGACWIKPWMDKPTNGINIAICTMNFLNAIILLILTDIFKGPGLVVGVTGVVFFIANAIFALFLLLFVIISATYSFFQKNPDKRYPTSRDDRASFVKSKSGLLPTEMASLGDIARTAGGDSRDPLSREASDVSSNHYSVSAPSMPVIDEKARPRSDMAAPYSRNGPGGSVSDLSQRSYSRNGPVGSVSDLSHPPPHPYSHNNGLGSARNSSDSRRTDRHTNNWQVGAGYEH